MKKFLNRRVPDKKVEYTREVHNQMKSEQEKRKAIKILIDVAVCCRPILSCDFCSLYDPDTECKPHTDDEIAEAVKLLRGLF